MDLGSDRYLFDPSTSSPYPALTGFDREGSFKINSDKKVKLDSMKVFNQ
jgi:hypothetical protein